MNSETRAILERAYQEALREAADDPIRQLDLTAAFTDNISNETEPSGSVCHFHEHRLDLRASILSLFDGIWDDALTRWTIVGILGLCLVGQVFLLMLTMR